MERNYTKPYPTYTDFAWDHFLDGIERLAKAINPHPYTVEVYGSHPDEQNDDCWTGDEFITNAEACDAYMLAVHGAPGAIGTSAYASNWMYIKLEGPDVRLIAKNPRYSVKLAERARREADAAERSERATQAGMAFGCDGYNDEMGW